MAISMSSEIMVERLRGTDVSTMRREPMTNNYAVCTYVVHDRFSEPCTLCWEDSILADFSVYDAVMSTSRKLQCVWGSLAKDEER
jgi:hypothetical protein